LRNVKQRCCNPNHPYFSAYKGKLWPAWAEDPKAFCRDVVAAIGERPTKAHSLDRKDNTKGYVPGNLRWATKRQQARNRSKPSTRFAPATTYHISEKPSSLDYMHEDQVLAAFPPYSPGPPPASPEERDRVRAKWDLIRSGKRRRLTPSEIVDLEVHHLGLDGFELPDVLRWAFDYLITPYHPSHPRASLALDHPRVKRHLQANRAFAKKVVEAMKIMAESRVDLGRAPYSANGSLLPGHLEQEWIKRLEDEAAEKARLEALEAEREAKDKARLFAEVREFERKRLIEDNIAGVESILAEAP
jgi:hypothetical protein